MKLHFVAILTAIALSGAALSPSLAASTTTTTTTKVATTTMTKPKTAPVPDAKRFTTEALAQASCASDTVVWANTKSKIYHLKGTSTYGKGKTGAYMCEADATAAEKFKPTKKPEKQVASIPAATTTTTTTAPKTN